MRITLKNLMIMLCLAFLVSLIVVTVIYLVHPSSTVEEDELATNSEDSDFSYSYTTEHELVVKRGQQEVARLERLFVPLDPSMNDVYWTNSGDYVVLFSDASMIIGSDGEVGGLEDQELMFVDSSSGKVERFPCPYCREFIPVGENQVLVWTNAPGEFGQLKYYNIEALDDEPVTVPVSHQLSSYKNLLTSTSTNVLIDFNYTGYGRMLQLVELDGTEHLVNDFGESRIDDYTGDHYTNSIRGVATEQSVYGPERMAVTFKTNPGLCVTESPVFVLDASAIYEADDPTSQLNMGAEIMETDMSAVEPPGFVANVEGGITVSDLWWGWDGKLRATMASWECGELSDDGTVEMSIYNEASLWRLEGNEWVNEDPDYVWMTRRFDESTGLVLVSQDCPSSSNDDSDDTDCYLGELMFEQGDERELIEGGVISIQVPPLGVS